MTDSNKVIAKNFDIGSMVLFVEQCEDFLLTYTNESYHITPRDFPESIKKYHNLIQFLTENQIMRDEFVLKEDVPTGKDLRIRGNQLDELYPAAKKLCLLIELHRKSGNNADLAKFGLDIGNHNTFQADTDDINYFIERFEHTLARLRKQNLE